MDCSDFCDEFIPTSFVYGSACAVCGYPAPTKQRLAEKATAAAAADAKTSLQRSKNFSALDRKDQRRPFVASRTITQVVSNKRSTGTQHHGRNSRSATQERLGKHSVGMQTIDLEDALSQLSDIPDSQLSSFRSDTLDTFSIDGNAATNERTVNHVRSTRQGKHPHTQRQTGGSHRRSENVDKKTSRTHADDLLGGNTLVRQSNLLALAGDAARQNGDNAVAQQRYTQAVALMSQLDLDRGGSSTHHGGLHGRSRIVAQQRTKQAPLHHVASDDVDEWDDPHGDADVDVAREWLAVAGLPTAHEAPPPVRSGYLDTSDGGTLALRTGASTPPTAAMRRRDSRRGGGQGGGRDYGAVERATAVSDHAHAGLLSTAGYGAGPKHDRLVQSFTTFACQAPALTRVNFSKWLRHVGCAGNADRYFAAFDRSAHKSWISLADFLMGCAAMDPRTPHTGRWRSERARYIFRFYAYGRKKMSQEYLTELLEHIAITSARQNSTVDHMRKNGASVTHRGGSGMSEDDFVRAVVSNDIRGTSRLLRFTPVLT